MGNNFSFLGDVLNPQSTEESFATFEVVNIPLEQIETNAQNNISKDNIADLAESIRTFGLKQNLEVTANSPDSSTPYRLISGERRYLALSFLSETDKSFSFAPCIITNPSEIDLDLLEEEKELLAIMETNAAARQLSTPELLNYVTAYQRIFDTLRTKGEATGRSRDWIAGRLKISAATVKRLQEIDKKLIPEVKDKISGSIEPENDKKITVNELTKLSTLSEEEQVAYIADDEKGEKFVPVGGEELARKYADLPTIIGENNVVDIIESMKELKHMLADCVTLSAKEYQKFAKQKQNITAAIYKIHCLLESK